MLGCGPNPFTGNKPKVSVETGCRRMYVGSSNGLFVSVCSPWVNFSCEEKHNNIESREACFRTKGNCPCSAHDGD